MKLINSFLTALSMYSKIPVKRPQWKEAYMDYVMCFFPVVGAIIGVLLIVFGRMAEAFQIHSYMVAAVCVVLPLWISGGIHMDGYLDTIDALSSYGSRERKLEILKDSHAGAFAVIHSGIYFLLSFGAWMGIQSQKGFLCVSIGFVISRALSGLSVAVFPKAKKEGSLVTLFADAAKKRAVVVTSILFFCAGVAGYCYLASMKGLIIAGVHVLVYGYYYLVSKQNFGGITGDLAGYFLQLTELLTLCTVSVVIG